MSAFKVTTEDYAQKLWTWHELKAAQARAFKESEEYLLPARFDDTSIPGLLPTIAYVDLNHLSPQVFADVVIEKLSGNSNTASCSYIRSKSCSPKSSEQTADES